MEYPTLTHKHAHRHTHAQSHTNTHMYPHIYRYIYNYIVYKATFQYSFPPLSSLYRSQLRINFFKFPYNHIYTYLFRQIFQRLYILNFLVIILQQAQEIAMQYSLIKPTKCTISNAHKQSRHYSDMFQQDYVIFREFLCQATSGDIIFTVSTTTSL